MESEQKNLKTYSVDGGKKSGGGSTGGLSHLEKQGLRACDKVQSGCSIAGLK